MRTQKIQSAHPALATFNRNNPDFDILHTDLNDKKEVERLRIPARGAASIIHLLINEQRVLRIAHLTEETISPEDTMVLAHKISSAGLHSAHAIASIPQHRFIRTYAAHFDNDGTSERTKKVHHAASRIVAKTRHLFSNIHSTVGSPYFRSLACHNIGSELIAYHEGLPGYQDIFGSLNYMGSNHCNSLFGPAAYFLDMMRIIDEYITDFNSNKPKDLIPAAWTLAARRPDLFELELDCANTNNLVPYLQLVNTVIERRLANEIKKTGSIRAIDRSSVRLDGQERLAKKSWKGMQVTLDSGNVKQTRLITGYDVRTGTLLVDKIWTKPTPSLKSKYSITMDPWQKMAMDKYPFNLPFQLPLHQIRTYVRSLDLEPADIVRCFTGPTIYDIAAGATPDTLNLPAPASKLTNAYNNMVLHIVAGKGIGQSRTVVSYNNKRIVAVDAPWDTIPDHGSVFELTASTNADRAYLGMSMEQYMIFITVHTTLADLAPYFGLDKIDLNEICKVETFLNVTGLQWQQMEELFVQGLSKEELANGVADKFYINNTGGTKKAMEIVLDTNGTNGPVYTITNLTTERLDRINRFIRLTKLLSWTYASLDCALASFAGDTKNYDITESTIHSLADLEWLRQQSGFTIDELCSFWWDMRTTGRGNGAYPQDLFDKVFNNPFLLNGNNPYADKSTTPFNPAKTIEWTINNVQGTDGIIRSRLSAALLLNDGDLVQLAHYIVILTGGTGSKIDLNLYTLSWFYRIAKTASFFRLKIEGCIMLLGLAANIKSESGKKDLALYRLTANEVIRLWKQARWYQTLPFTIYETDYIINGKEGPNYKAPYRTDDVTALAESLWLAAGEARVTAGSFVFADIDVKGAEKVYTQLAEKKFINTNGILLNDTKKFSEAASYFPLTPTSFKKGIIKEEKEIKKIFADLTTSHPKILVNFNAAKNSALLSSEFQNNSNLDFLFPGDINGDNKRNQVRAILVENRTRIQIQEFAFLFPLEQNSFENDSIDAAQSVSIFDLLKKENPKDFDRPLLSEGGYLNANFNADTNLDFLFLVKDRAAVNRKRNKNAAIPKLIPLEEPGAEAKRKMVKEILLAVKKDITGVVETMNRCADLQLHTILNGVSGFLQTTPETLTSLLPFVLDEVSIPELRDQFIHSIRDGQVDEKVYNFISTTARTLLLFNGLSFTTAEIAAVINTPASFNIDTGKPLSYYNLQCLYRFKDLQQSLNDKADMLLAYFYLPDEDSDYDLLMSFLSGFTSWNKEEITQVVKRLHTGLSTVDSIVKIRNCFSISAKTQVSIAGLLELTETLALGIEESAGVFSPDHWNKYNNQAAILQGAVNASFAGSELVKVTTDNTAVVNSHKRDALVGYAIWLLNKNGVTMKSPSDLYQYLLIDVEMGGCDNISKIAQAICSVQLYMERCRLMLEPGVTGLAHIPQTWWNWMSSYRLWEVNRKVFLYPENYIDPATRKNMTPLFEKIADELQQTNIDDATIKDAYKTYFAGLSEMATLVPCESYQCNRLIPGVKEAVDTLFMFGRTQIKPYRFYHRHLDRLTGWTPWQKIDVGINSPFISPVYAFDRLYIFWAEPKSIESSKMKDGKSIPVTTKSSTLKFSFLDEQDKWVQPQELAADIISSYQEDYTFDSVIGDRLDTMKNEFGNTNGYWHVPYALYVPQAAFSDPERYPDTTYIGIKYGLRKNVSRNSAEIKAFTVGPSVSPAQFTFDNSVKKFIDLYDDLRSVNPGNDNSTAINLIPGLYLDPSMNAGQLPTIFPNRDPGQNCPSYRAVLIRKGNQLAIENVRMSNIVDENYYTDDFSQYPQNKDLQGAFGLLGNISGIHASIVTVKNRPYHFIFDNGDESFLVEFGGRDIPFIADTLVVESPGTMPAGAVFSVWSEGNFVTKNLDKLEFRFSRLNTSVVTKLNKALITGDLDALLSPESQQTEELPFKRLKPLAQNILEPKKELDFDGPYGNYFWETFFHAPFLIAKTLSVHRRHKEAKDWYQYIFNPTKVSDVPDVNSSDRIWQFLPFRTMTKERLTEILTNPAQINAFNNDPFNPDAIARLRISAYAKSVVMRYIDNLVEWADQLYEQDTREAINEAVNLYVMASNLLGKRPRQVGESARKTTLNFNEIKAYYSNKEVTSGVSPEITEYTIVLAGSASGEDDAYNGMYIEVTTVTGTWENYITSYEGGVKKIAKLAYAWNPGTKEDVNYKIIRKGIPEFLIRLENTAHLLSKRETLTTPDPNLPFNDINSYFTIPENAEFIGYWDKVEDRLYKVRHCMNLRGQVRSLALFAPALDPRMVIGGFNGTTPSNVPVQIPPYRFLYMIEKAKSFAGNVISLGSNLLSILEKKDAEALGMLRATQEKTLLELATFIKEQQIADLVRQHDSLNESLSNAVLRHTYYKTLVQAGLSSKEIANIQASKTALLFTVASQAIKTASAVGYSLPQAGSPFAMTYGGQQIGATLTALGGVLDIGTTISSFYAQMSLTMAGYERREQEWKHYEELAASDMKQIGYQLQSNEINQAMSQRDLENHLVSIRQSEEVESFLENKFTNVQLYQWMVSRISTVYFQTYTLAYNLSLAAENAYRFEMNNNQSFVNYGNWNNLQKGLLAGEGLMLSLNQMEKSYAEGYIRRMEIEKNISLMQLNPTALLNLINDGECIFELTEKLFDDDFPGHYARTIKTISISIPAIVGPYQNIKATLTQLSNQVILKPVAKAVSYLMGESDSEMPDASTLRSNWQVSQQIALSTGVADDGLFELRFDDDRYLPFEGTGAVSSWKLSMPKATNRINYQSISDVIIQLQYMSIDGGADFRKNVTDIPGMKDYSGSKFLSLASAYADPWFEFLNIHTQSKEQNLKFGVRNFAVDNLQETELTGFYFDLDMHGVDTISYQKNFIRLSFPTVAGNREILVVDVKVDDKGSVMHVLEKPLKVSEIDGYFTIAFIRENLPKQLVKDKYLDPAKLKDIKLIFFYKGTLNWK